MLRGEVTQISQNVFRGAANYTPCRHGRRFCDCDVGSGTVFGFSVGIGTVGSYTIAGKERYIHQNKAGRDALGTGVLRRGRRIVKNAFGGDAMSRDTTRYWHLERGMRCCESPCYIS